MLTNKAAPQEKQSRENIEGEMTFIQRSYEDDDGMKNVTCYHCGKRYYAQGSQKRYACQHST